MVSSMQLTEVSAGIIEINLALPSNLKGIIFRGQSGMIGLFSLNEELVFMPEIG